MRVKYLLISSLVLLSFGCGHTGKNGAVEGDSIHSKRQCEVDASFFGEKLNLTLFSAKKDDGKLYLICSGYAFSAGDSFFEVAVFYPDSGEVTAPICRSNFEVAGKSGSFVFTTAGGFQVQFFAKTSGTKLFSYTFADSDCE